MNWKSNGITDFITESMEQVKIVSEVVSSNQNMHLSTSAEYCRHCTIVVINFIMM